MEAARAAYDKIGTTLQKGLVANYSDLVSAEQRIKLLDPANQDKEETTDDDNVVATPEAPKGPNGFVVFLVLVALAVVLVYIFRKQLSEAIIKIESEKFEARKAELEKAFADEGKENETEN